VVFQTPFCEKITHGVQPHQSRPTFICTAISFDIHCTAADGAAALLDVARCASEAERFCSYPILASVTAAGYLRLSVRDGNVARAIRFASRKGIGLAMSEVFVVDDDPLVGAALSIVLGAEGFVVTSFVDGESFLDTARLRAPGCVLIDVHLPGCSGLELLKALSTRGYAAPIFVISGRGDIPTAVDAIRNGAFDFIEKPFEPATVIGRVRDAIQAWQNRAQEDSILTRDFRGRERLTARERDVLERIARGISNKEIAGELGISPRTVEVHRAHIMEKLAAKNAADLMRIVLGRYRLHLAAPLSSRYQRAS
jgi:two-component system, LuxR family, response regulator FixJ